MNSIENILKIVPENNRSVIIFLKNSLEENLSLERIIFLGLHGSSRHISVSPEGYSDIDLELVLDQVSASDLSKVKEIIRKSGKKIECQVRSLQEISDPNSLIFKTGYKIFMYWAYANGITLSGKNIYKDLVTKFTDQEYRDSLLISIQLNWKDLRKKYLEGAESKELYKLVEVLLFDILLFCDCLDYKELDKKKLFESKRYDVSRVSADFFKAFLTEKEIEYLMGLQNYMMRSEFDVGIIEPLQTILDAFISMTNYHKKSGPDNLSPTFTTANS